MRFPLRPLLLAVPMGLLLPAGAEPRRDESSTAVKLPPQPVPQALTVARGGHLEIAFRAYGLQREVPKFLLRSRPEKGKLSAPKDNGRGWAAVAYEPPGDLAVKAEKFTYAAQNSAGVSAPAVITIAIVDEAPRLITPRELTFAGVQPGTTARQEFEIANLGGGLAEGEVVAGEPWQIDGSPAYRLRAGERKKLTLLFSPPTGGSSRGELLFTSQPDRATPLSGEAVVTSAATPAPPPPAGAPSRATEPAAPALATAVTLPTATPPPPAVPARRPRAAMAVSASQGAHAAPEPEQDQPEAPAAAAAEADRPSLGVVTGSRVTAWTSNSITLQWPAAVSGGLPVRVEFRSGLERDDAHKLRELWTTVTNAQFHTAKENVIAELHGLQPANLYTFRIVSAAAAPGTPPLFFIDAATAPGGSTAVFTPLRLGLAALVIFAGLEVWRRVRRER